MAIKKSTVSASIFQRLLEVTNCKDYKELSQWIGMNESTLRGRISRGAVPFDEIIEKLDGTDLLFVLKNGQHEHTSVPHDQPHTQDPANKYIAAPAFVPKTEKELRAQVEILKQIIIELKRSEP